VRLRGASLLEQEGKSSQRIDSPLDRDIEISDVVEDEVDQRLVPLLPDELDEGF